MVQLHQDFISGSLSAQLLSGAGSFDSSTLVNVITVNSPDVLKVTINPFGLGGVPPEIVYITAHTASATSATINRSQDGTAAQDFPAGTSWFIGPVTSDWAYFQSQLDAQLLRSNFNAKGQTYYSTASNAVAVVAAGTVLGQVLMVDPAQATNVRHANFPYQVANAGARPAGSSSSYVGMIIYQLDNKRYYQCTAVGTPSTWRYIGGGKAPGALLWSASTSTIANNDQTNFVTGFSAASIGTDPDGMASGGGVLTIGADFDGMRCRVNGRVTFAAHATGSRGLAIGYTPSGGSLALVQVDFRPPGGGHIDVVGGSDEFVVGAGDTFALYPYQDSGAGLALSNSPSANPRAHSLSLDFIGMT